MLTLMVAKTFSQSGRSMFGKKNRWGCWLYQLLNLVNTQTFQALGTNLQDILGGRWQQHPASAPIFWWWKPHQTPTSAIYLIYVGHAFFVCELQIFFCQAFYENCASSCQSSVRLDVAGLFWWLCFFRIHIRKSANFSAKNGLGSIQLLSVFFWGG